MRRTWMFLPSIVAACGGSDSAAPLPPVDEAALEVEVVALAQTVHPLDPVVARITNRSTEVVYENLCGGALEGYGYVPGEWNGSYGYGRAGPLGRPGQTSPGLRPIGPGASVLDTFWVNSQAYAGSWRFNFDLRDRDEDLLPLARRVSQPFLVDR